MKQLHVCPQICSYIPLPIHSSCFNKCLEHYATRFLRSVSHIDEKTYCNDHNHKTLQTRAFKKPNSKTSFEMLIYFNIILSIREVSLRTFIMYILILKLLNLLWIKNFILRQVKTFRPLLSFYLTL